MKVDDPIPSLDAVLRPLAEHLADVVGQVGSDIIPASEMKNLFPGTTDQYWATKRHFGGGPTFVKLQRKIFYRRTDIEAWIGANLRTRTDRPVGGADT